MSLPFGRVNMIGLGYIGLPTAVMLANCGIQTTGVDINPEVVDIVNRGEIHIVEPGLEQLVHHVVAKKLLRASTTPEAADAFIIAVPTPFKGDHEPDLAFVEAAARSIAPLLQKGNLVILESTSPVGTTEKIAEWLAEARTDLSFPQQVGIAADVNIAYCPERVLPGKILTELVTNDRVVGGLTIKCAEQAIHLYQQFVKGECIVTNARTAEMCKLTENSYRDTNIAFANELSIICDKFGISVWELIQLANHHPRVNILQPGPGVGGHCIAVDPWFIVSQAPDDTQLIRSARAVNNRKPRWVIQKVQVAIAQILQQQPQKTAKDVKIACFGLAFKPDIDDLRESPALEITKEIASAHPGDVLVVEPNISVLPSSLIDLVKKVDADDAIKQADILLLLVDHQPFRAMKMMMAAMAADMKKIIDTRGAWLA